MHAKEHPQNIYIIGAQSTGKTTLLNALRGHFARSPSISESNKPRFIEETARIVFKQEDFKFAAVDTLSNFDEYLGIQRTILKAQLEAENEALRKRKWFISDRSGLDCLVYVSKYVGKEGAEQILATPELAKLKARMQEGRVILCEPVADWLKDDGTGFRPIPEHKEQWFAVHKEFCELLDGFGLRYEVLPARITSLEERAMFVLSA